MRVSRWGDQPSWKMNELPAATPQGVFPDGSHPRLSAPAHSSPNFHHSPLSAYPEQHPKCLFLRVCLLCSLLAFQKRAGSESPVEDASVCSADGLSPGLQGCLAFVRMKGSGKRGGLLNHQRSRISHLPFGGRCCHQPVERNWIDLGVRKFILPWLYIFSKPTAIKC